jgi:hypothetical protein
MGSNLFSDLATELQLQIFAELDPPALLSLSQVSLQALDLKLISVDEEATY